MAQTILTNAGAQRFITYLTNALSGSYARFVGWGIGSGQTVASTDLAQPGNGSSQHVYEARATGAESLQTTVIANDTYQVQATMSPVTSPRSVSEVALFTTAGAGVDPVVGGVMCIYSDFVPIPLAVGDTIQFTHKLQMLAG